MPAGRERTERYVKQTIPERARWSGFAARGLQGGERPGALPVHRTIPAGGRRPGAEQREELQDQVAERPGEEARVIMIAAISARPEQQSRPGRQCGLGWRCAAGGGAVARKRRGVRKIISLQEGA